MGLKKENYEVKKLGVVLPAAYAVVDSLTVYGNTIHATIAVQTSREKAFTHGAFETVEVEIHNADRTQNPYKVVYDYVKGVDTYKSPQHDYPVIKPRAFHGWEDDIVTED